MTGIYQKVLPQAFPYVLRAPKVFIQRAVTALLDPDRVDGLGDNGSSFAVTVDNWDGTQNLWLSVASCNFIQMHFEGYDDIQETQEGRR